ncbi:winged helix-turn-helix transcriptional regulator [Flavobacterium limi]|uniref:Transcriptional regulator n=1 Tax=Flavobacterium limi TaxID=2045105 RepID=A0ABQ1UPI2_9FLAO|nr:helix-turn-helix domain-containing protein [Flavobacterium limi]GGF24008.1 transcriptional regulator [Flavobacterium limi]
MIITDESIPDGNDRKERILKCKTEVVSIMDAIYVIAGSKWRIPITIALMEGNRRFGEIMKEIPKITSKVLAQQLKEMELNGFVEKKIFKDSAIRTEYELTEYSWSVKPVILALRDFGISHREKLRQEIL